MPHPTRQDYIAGRACAEVITPRALSQRPAIDDTCADCEGQLVASYRYWDFVAVCPACAPDDVEDRR